MEKLTIEGLTAVAEDTESIPEFAIGLEGVKGKPIRLSISGRIELDNLLSFRSELENFFERMVPASITLDLAGLEYVDSAGALALIDFKSEAKELEIPFNFENASKKIKGVMSLIDPEALTLASRRPEERPPGFFILVGETARLLWKDFYNLQSFLGDLLYALAYCLRHPHTLRWGDILLYMTRSGVEALPILSMMSLGTGAVIAFMSALQLKQLGAIEYVAPLVAIAVVKELGPLLTAILVSGRSGSAFAAEIGTMKVKEEVDALSTMGFEPVRFLSVPKVLASIIVLPLLTLYSMFFCIAGGFLVGVYLLDLTAFSYIDQTMKNVTLFDLVASLIKSVVFAVVVAGVGCQRGFEVRGGAEAVGTMTTSAVVTSLFIIVMIDGAFAIVLHYIR
ncbi:MAG: MlaE family lipid ABC transporter permease subunit [Syntrophales bacterium]|nr:MlaE family lipid ABC transporter permease subunit [Syntrophales bacterium]MDD5642667.1 MlaE family lipid ABC transporter permease subunit [Syntrophales bacterium]